MNTLKNIGLIAALMLSPMSALAHHGSSGQFDTSKTVVLSGEITRVRLVNPHAYVYFDSTSSNGETVNMRCELQSGSLLKRNGWTKDMFEIGSHITIVGSPDRSDPTTCYMSEITFENGLVATRNSTFDDDGNVLAEIRPLTLDDGTPNIDGNWAMVREKGAPPGSGSRPAEIKLTQAGAAAVEGATAEDNPRLQCEATNIVMDWWFDQMVNSIDQHEDVITMKYGFMDLERAIYLDGRDMPADYSPSRAGFSTGHWEGNTLVVTTTGFDEGWINAPLGNPSGGDNHPPRPDGAQGPDGHQMPNGAAAGDGQRPPRPDGAQASNNSDQVRPPRPEGQPGGPVAVKNSTQMTITERFTLSEDGTQLTRNYTIVDPVYLEAPIEGSDTVTLTDDAYEPYNCDDLTYERSE